MENMKAKEFGRDDMVAAFIVGAFLLIVAIFFYELFVVSLQPPRVIQSPAYENITFSVTSGIITATLELTNPAISRPFGYITYQNYTVTHATELLPNGTTSISNSYVNKLVSLKCPDTYGKYEYNCTSER
jgi:hypothetical protein